ncbi:MAG: SPOR domain-containing protein [Salinibacter sp.]
MPDPEPITPLLAERLDISPNRTQALLQSMLQELKDRAASEGVHLSDLGTFQEDDGTLAFIPSPSLRRRVNHQFEGLSPEDLAGPPSARPEDDAPPSLRESSEEDDDTSPAEPSPAEPQSPDDEPLPTTDDEGAPALDPMDEDGDDEPTETPDQPVGPEPDDAPAKPATPGPGGVPGEAGESAEPSIPTLDPIEDEDDGDEADMPPPGDGGAPPEGADEEAPSEEEDEEAPVGSSVSYSLIGSLLALVVLVGIGWLVFSETTLWSSNSATYESSDQQTTQSADPEGSNQSPDQAPDDASADGQTERHAGIPPGDDSGDAANMEPGAWTIVVASLSSRPNAEETAAKYEDQFNSTEVMPTTTDSRTLYRVAVGRYDSEAAAQRALDANASMLPSGAWLHELR